MIEIVTQSPLGATVKAYNEGAVTLAEMVEETGWTKSTTWKRLNGKLTVSEDDAWTMYRAAVAIDRRKRRRSKRAKGATATTDTADAA